MPQCCTPQLQCLITAQPAEALCIQPMRQLHFPWLTWGFENVRCRWGRRSKAACCLACSMINQTYYKLPHDGGRGPPVLDIVEAQVEADSLGQQGQQSPLLQLVVQDGCVAATPTVGGTGILPALSCLNCLIGPRNFGRRLHRHLKALRWLQQACRTAELTWAPRPGG